MALTWRSDNNSYLATDLLSNVGKHSQSFFAILVVALTVIEIFMFVQKFWYLRGFASHITHDNNTFKYQWINLDIMLR